MGEDGRSFMNELHSESFMLMLSRSAAVHAQSFTLSQDSLHRLAAQEPAAYPDTKFPGGTPPFCLVPFGCTPRNPFFE